jgi:isopentenyl-diphosphate delta-isomerase
VSELILVDEQDREIGFADKLAAHRGGGRLHRAFSVFIFNDAGELLLQQRAAVKYHFAGLWSNSCCGHPLRGQATAEAARRRLHEELGFDAPLREIFAMAYEAADPASGLTEREFDHVFGGRHDGAVSPAPAEVSAVRWIEPGLLGRELQARPECFTPWLGILLPRVLDSITG